MRKGAMTAYGRFCCKTILSAPARKIDSRSRSKAQHRFKSVCNRIRLFQIPIPQTSVGDFCNKIGPERRFGNVAFPPLMGAKRKYSPHLRKGTFDPQRSYRHSRTGFMECPGACKLQRARFSRSFCAAGPAPAATSSTVFNATLKLNDGHP